MIKGKLMTRHLFVTPNTSLIGDDGSKTRAPNQSCLYHVQLVLRYCCKTSWRAMLHVLPAAPCNLILLRDRFERQWKGAQLRYSTRFAIMLEKRLHDVCWAIPHLFERLFLISWQNNKDCHITMPLSLKTMEIQIKGDQWNKRFRACLHGGGNPR